MRDQPCQLQRHHRPAALAAAWMLLCTPAAAIEDRADVDPSDSLRHNQSVAWKATASRYKDSAAGWASDVNLRGNTERLTFWVGDYKAPDRFEQLRAGLESGVALGSGKVVGSVQLASGGFVGASLTWDGRDASRQAWAPLLGIGRTNTRPYVNLNFDPNDSLMWGLTRQLSSGGVLMAYQVRDDRLGTGQRVTHVVWRGPVAGQRLTLDGFTRQGSEARGEPVFRGYGLTGTLDMGPGFVRLGWDRHANYTAADVLRLSVGVRL
jgi:hypothetical protein